MTILSTIVDIFSRSSNQPVAPTGADAVRTAMREYQDIAGQEFSAILGEPDIILHGGNFFNDPKVVVPIENAPFDENQKLFFDLPRGNGYEMDEFNELLSLFDLNFDTMEELKGERVAVKFAAGNLIVDWSEVEDAEYVDKAGEEEVEEEEVGEEDSESEDSVNVEETTISTGDDDD